MTRDTLAPGVAVLRRTLPHALAVADPGGSDPLDWSGSEYVDRMAADLVSAWTPADRLAIAGITEERLGEAILVAAWGYDFDPPDAARIGADLAPKVLARLTTPVTPEGGEL